MAFIPNDPELPDVDDAAFERDQVIDNPYSPFAVGDLLSYVATEAGSDDLAERGDVFVTAATRMIEGVKATVVRDTVYDDEGRWLEDTLDWYAQDTGGNVWYLGESSFSFEYDEETGAFLGASPDGSWEWGVDGALPGIIRPAVSSVGDSYFQEFYPGVAEDAAQVLALDEEVSLKIGNFADVIRTFDFSTLELDAREFKYAAPGVGVILEEGLDEDDVVEDRSALVGVRSVTPTDEEADDALLADLAEGEAILPEEVEREDFEQDDDNDEGDESEDFTITFLGGVDDLDNAVGVYEYDVATGEIGEGRILFDSSDRTKIGARKTVEVDAGDGLGVFVVSGAGAGGVDLDNYEDGGLFFRNTSADAPAALGDPLSPVATDAEGALLPFTVFHAFDDADDGINLLNHGGAAQATELELYDEDEREDEEEADNDGDEDDDGDDVDEDELDDLADFDDDGVLVGFEERMSTDPEHDGDYNDVVLAISDDRLSPVAAAEIAGMFRSEIYAGGTAEDDRLVGRAFDDRLFGLGGDDFVWGRGGDDRLRGGTGDDRLKGGRGDDHILGGAGDDVARFNGDADGFEIETDGGRTVVTDIDAFDGDYGVDTLRGVEALRFDDLLLA